MRRILTVVIGLCGFCLHGCEDVVNIDLGKEKPVLVLNSLLVEGDDTVRVVVSQTRPYRDTGEWKYVTEAEVRLYENGKQVGLAEWNGRNCFVLPYRVAGGKTYRVVARVPGRGTVSGETTVPERVKDYKMEIWQEVRDSTFADGPRARYHWQDLPDGIHYYWLTMRSSNVPYYDDERRGWVRDTVNWEPGGYLYTESPLPDRFNKNGEMDYDGNYCTYYEHYIRVEGIASAEQRFELSYESQRIEYFTTVISLIHADRHCDAYLKSIVEKKMVDGVPSTEPWMYSPADMYSNVHGGTGIIGSYSLVEVRLDSPDEPGQWGPGVPCR